MSTRRDPVEARRRAVDEQLDVAKETLRELVAINSFTRNVDGVNRNGRVLAEKLAPLGFDAVYFPSAVPHHGDHLVLTRRGRGEPAILLVSHLDTVYSPEEERRHDFSWREEGDTVYGPGVIDIKGGSLVALLALEVLAKTEPRLFDAITWHVLLNAAEEEGSSEFAELARTFARQQAQACLVFEHGSDRDRGGTLVTSSRRGSARFVIETFGRPAHAGSAHRRGANAIRELARAVERIESMTEEDGSVTFNVGRIEGGIGTNTVPAYARCDVDLRADDVEAYQRAIDAVLALDGTGEIRSREDGYRCSVRVTQYPSYPPWPANPASAALAADAARAGELIGVRVAAEHRLGASDGSHVWDLVPTLDGLGPIGADLHSAEHDPPAGKRQESLRWSSVRERTMLAATLLALLADGLCLERKRQSED